MPTTKQAVFASINALCSQLQNTKKQAGDGANSSAPGADVPNNEVPMSTGELAAEVSSELKSRTAATESAPAAKVEGPKEQQLMIGHESHQVDGIDLPIGSEAKDPGTSTPVQAGGEKYASLNFAQTRDAATKLANEILKEAVTAAQQPAPQATTKVAEAAAAGEKAAAVLLQKRAEIVRSAMQDASIDADLLIGFFKRAEEEEAKEQEDASSEESAPPEGASKPSEGNPPPGDAPAPGSDPLAGLLEAGPGDAAPPVDAGAAGAAGDMTGAGPGGMPGEVPGGAGVDPGGMGGDPQQAEVIQQLLALLAQPQLDQLSAAGPGGAKVASAVNDYLKSASPRQRQLRDSIAKDLKSYIREVV